MPIKMSKPDPKDRVKKAADQYAKNIHSELTAEDVRAKYAEGANRKTENTISSAGKPAMQKTRKKGSTTHTASGKPVKGKTESVAKYKDGTQGIKVEKSKDKKKEDLKVSGRNAYKTLNPDKTVKKDATDKSKYGKGTSGIRMKKKGC